MPSGDDDAIAARCTALPFNGTLLRGELLRELCFGDEFFGEVLAGAFLPREILSPDFLASRVGLECRTFICLKWSTIIDGTRAEPFPIRRSVAMHMGFAVRTHAFHSLDSPGTTVLFLPASAGRDRDKPDCRGRGTLRHQRGAVKDAIVAPASRWRRVASFCRS